MNVLPNAIKLTYNRFGEKIMNILKIIKRFQKFISTVNFKLGTT